jgi:hypothetical protein
MMTTSRRSSIGARHWSTYARKIVPFIGPSITNGATIPSWRSPTTRAGLFILAKSPSPLARNRNQCSGPLGDEWENDYVYIVVKQQPQSN